MGLERSFERTMRSIDRFVDGLRRKSETTKKENSATALNQEVSRLFHDAIAEAVKKAYVAGVKDGMKVLDARVRPHRGESGAARPETRGARSRRDASRRTSVR